MAWCRFMQAFRTRQSFLSRCVITLTDTWVNASANGLRTLEALIWSGNAKITKVGGEFRPIPPCRFCITKAHLNRHKRGEALPNIVKQFSRSNVTYIDVSKTGRIIRPKKNWRRVAQYQGA